MWKLFRARYLVGVILLVNLPKLPPIVMPKPFLKEKFTIWVFIFCFATVAKAGTTQDLFKGVELWQSAAEASLSENGQSLIATGDEGVVIGEAGKQPDLESKRAYGDAIVTVDFKLSQNASAYIYLHSRYGIALANSADKPQLTSADMGGLEQGKANQKGVSVLGKAPLVNAAAKAGEWQKLEIRFRAPRYNETGGKSEAAFFPDVKVNKKVVQRNVLVAGITAGSVKNWEQRSAPLSLSIRAGQIALKNFEVRPADFSSLQLPTESGGDTNMSVLVDYVAQGKGLFESFGCRECHATREDDTTIKSGPNLYGLYQFPAREREIVERGEGHRFTIKADKNYIFESIRHPEFKLATREKQNAGEAYPPVMPAFDSQLISEAQLEAISDYLATLNTYQVQGPVVKLKPEESSENDNPLDDPLQFFVAQRTRIQRGPMPGMSGRAIHVGLNNGISYSFDPRMMAIVKLWQGGFLNMAGELQNRGGRGLDLGVNSKNIDFGKLGYLFAPLNPKGNLIDFSFKEAVFGDKKAAAVLLESDKELAQLIQQVDAKFNGYTLDASKPDAIPKFQYRVGGNNIVVSTDIRSSGNMSVVISGDFNQAQRFILNTDVLTKISVKGAKIKNNHLVINPGEAQQVLLTGTVALSNTHWKAAATHFEYDKQKVVTVEAEAELPAGYRIESIYPPKDNFGRKQLFEALGVAVAKNGTTVVGTRTAGIWRIDQGYWRPFAEGTFDSLGLVIDDDRGEVLTVGQKAELTRIRDSDGDGKADSFKTLFDAFAYHGNYHSYMHGPVQVSPGKYYIALNLVHAGSAYKAGGLHMGTFGGYRGWGMRVDENGVYQTWVNGLRSPAGVGVNPEGKIYYTENQGEYVGTSKMFAIEKDGFYGHPSGLVDLPGQKLGSQAIQWDKVKNSRQQAVLLFPHNHLANSPGNLAWNLSQGKFGMFDQQIFVGDQTLSSLFRIVLQEVKGIEQGVVIPFADKLESGVMRPVFLADGSLLLGQTGRGWQAKGGKMASLQKISWDGKTIPEEIFTVNIQPSGFEIVFTQGIEKIGAKDISIQSWRYRDSAEYGSPELGKRTEEISALVLSKDAKRLKVKIKHQEETQLHPEQTSRVYHIVVDRKVVYGGEKNQTSRKLEAWYTVNAWPESEY